MDIKFIPNRWGEGITLTVDDFPQATVDLDDQSNLVDEYAQNLGFFADEIAPAKTPLRVLHLGAGALALARYIAATRPGSYQQAVDINPELVETVRAHAPLEKGVKVKIRIGDAREELAKAPAECYDLIVGDIFASWKTPRHVTTQEFLTDVRRVLRPDGYYAANLCDGGTLQFSKGIVAAAQNVFNKNLVLSDSTIFSGRRYGNVLLFSAKQQLPIDTFRYRVSQTAFPNRIKYGRELSEFISGTKATCDADATDSKPPPAMRF